MAEKPSVEAVEKRIGIDAKKEEYFVSKKIEQEKNFFQIQFEKNPWLANVLFVLAVVLFIGIVLVLQDISSKVYIEKSQISAPIISISPSVPGIIDKFYVKEGDVVFKGEKLAKVGSQILTARTKGVIVSLEKNPGQIATSQTSVVEMIDRSEFRVVGRLQEDKGLKDIEVGQKVVFTVDAFGDKQYVGFVDSIQETARQSDIVFSISDKRQENEFEVRAKFDVDLYPELKNGMSAKMWVFK